MVFWELCRHWIQISEVLGDSFEIHPCGPTGCPQLVLKASPISCFVTACEEADLKETRFNIVSTILDMPRHFLDSDTFSI